MLKEKVLKTITENNLIEPGDKIVLGVSGGPDSICMLDILNDLSEKLDFEMIVCHINHMIREEAVLDEEYVKDFCEKINVPFYLKKADIKKQAKENKRGTEETGREVRYGFFEEILKKTKSNKIATAHNLNDNSETVLMNIFRGSGLSGLKGIDKKRDNKYIRPLIDCLRTEIEEYCTEKKLNPRIDKTNMENIYTRNKIRNVCIPYIEKEFNSNIVETIGRLSEIVSEETEYIDSIIREEYERIVIEKKENEIILDLKKFNNLKLVIKKRIVLYTIRELMGTTNGIEKVNIDDIIKLCGNNIGNKYLKPIKHLKVTIKSQKIFFQVLVDIP